MNSFDVEGKVGAEVQDVNPSERMLPCPFCGSSAVERKAEMLAYYVECSKCEIGTKFLPTINHAITVWNKRADASRWVPVQSEDDLPKESGNYWACYRFGISPWDEVVYGIAEFEDGQWQWPRNRVIAWQPLPQPYDPDR